MSLLPFNLSSLVIILKTFLNSCRMIPVIPTYEGHLDFVTETDV